MQDFERELIMHYYYEDNHLGPYHANSWEKHNYERYKQNLDDELSYTTGKSLDKSKFGTKVIK